MVTLFDSSGKFRLLAQCASRDPMASRLNGLKHCDRHVRSTVVQIRLEAHMKCIIWKMKYNSMFVLGGRMHVCVRL